MVFGKGSVRWKRLWLKAFGVKVHQRRQRHKMGHVGPPAVCTALRGGDRHWKGKTGGVM